jgi:hypothetical protein
MADIKHAAQWMAEGKKVRRPYLDGGISMGTRENFMAPLWILVFHDGAMGRGRRTAAFDVLDLLADDWEIAE